MSKPACLGVVALALAVGCSSETAPWAVTQQEVSYKLNGELKTAGTYPVSANDQGEYSVHVKAMAEAAD